MLFWVNVSFITLDLVKAIMVCGIGTYQPIFLHVGLLVGYWQGPTKIEVASVLNFRKFSRFFETSKKKKAQ